MLLAVPQPNISNLIFGKFSATIALGGSTPTLLHHILAVLKWPTKEQMSGPDTPWHVAGMANE